jgi:hypothetical protein
MARYFSHAEIFAGQLPATRDIAWLAGQLAELAPFKEGCAVVCGSVAWNSHSGRSDIDIAHFSTVAHPHIEPEIQATVALFGRRTKHRVIPPRIDVITIGVEAEAASPRLPQSASNGDSSVQAGRSSMEALAARGNQATIFTDTYVRFSDHIGALAHAKGDAWKRFLDRHLSQNVAQRSEIQHESIRSYVAATTNAWSAHPLHPLSMDASEQLTQRQLDLIGQAENYPINLMRRLLGALGRYPRPDRIADVRRAFEELSQPWAKQILAAAAPFFALDAQYATLIAEVGQSNDKLTPATYFERLSTMFDALPFDRIQEAAWEYLDPH